MSTPAAGATAIFMELLDSSILLRKTGLPTLRDYSNTYSTANDA